MRITIPSASRLAGDPVAMAFDFEELTAICSAAYGDEGESNKARTGKASIQLGRVLGGMRLSKRSSCMEGTEAAGRGLRREGVVMTAMSWSSVMEVRGT